MGSVQSHRTALSVLGVCFTLSLLGRGLGESFTVFLLPIANDFGWDRGAVVSIYSLTALAGGLGSPVIGRLLDAFGARGLYGFGLCLLAAALIAASHAQALWQFQIAIGVAVGFAIGCIGNVPNAVLLGRWFGPRLPTAMAVVYSATGAGVLLALPLAQVLIERIGWRNTYLAFGAFAALLVVPLLLLPWRRYEQGAAHVVRAAAIADGPGWTLRSALRHHAFWALFATFFFTAIGMYAIAAQVVAYLVDAGFAPLQAATAWGFSGVALVVGMLGVSALDGVIGRRRSVLLSYAVSIVGIVLLRALKLWPNGAVLAGFVICFGSMIGSRGPLITATAMRIFRGPRVGTIYGCIAIGSGLGSALGSWCGGLIHDATGSYDPVIAFALVSVVLGLLPFLTVRALR